VVYGESGDRVPVRMPPIPSTEPLTKKAKQAAALRQAAEMMENEHRRDLESFGWVNSNRLSKFNYSTDKLDATVADISFMEVGTNLLIQVRLNYKEKE
jgi:hypothetical protein